MAVATDRFVAFFGDRPLEFELAIEEISYEGGEVVVDWSVEKISDAIGGVGWEIVLNTPDGTDSTTQGRAATRGSGTLRAPAEPGDTVDLIFYDTFNTDHEPGDGLDGPGQAQANVKVPRPEPVASEIAIVSCSGDATVEPGEQTTVEVVVRNDNPVTAPATVTITAADASAERRVSLPAGGEQTVSATFAFDSPGEYEPTVEVAL